jgi:hypothetical protein
VGVEELQHRAIALDLVRHDEEPAAIGRPSAEPGLELFAGRQVALLSVLQNLRMIELVAALVAREQDSVVLWEEEHSVG